MNSVIAVPRKNGATVVVGADHAWFVERGTGIYNTSGTGRRTPWVYKHRKYGWILTRGQRPQPYVRPAMDATTLGSKKILKREFRRSR